MVGIHPDGFQWMQFIVYSALLSAFVVALMRGATDLLRGTDSARRRWTGWPRSRLTWAAALAAAVMVAAFLSSPSWSPDARSGFRALPYALFTLWFAYMVVMGVIGVLAAFLPSNPEEREPRDSGT